MNRFDRNLLGAILYTVFTATSFFGFFAISVNDSPSQLLGQIDKLYKENKALRQTLKKSTLLSKCGQTFIENAALVEVNTILDAEILEAYKLLRTSDAIIKDCESLHMSLIEQESECGR